MSTSPGSPVDTEEVFGFKADLAVSALPDQPELAGHVPDVDAAYRFTPAVTRALLAGFGLNRRVLVHGWHGTGKSTHVEQVAAALNWPLVRVNLDGHITRMDLVGRDGIVLRDGAPVTEFQEGILPWALNHGVALLFDELDAGRPDVMFVIQRLLEREGRFTLLDQNRVLTPHPNFRLFATSNTIGMGNLNGLYHGTQLMNHAQIDRWSIVAQLDYLDAADEVQIVGARVPELLATADGTELAGRMVDLAALTRNGFAAGDISTVMSPRTIISWAENYQIFNDVEYAFRLAFLNKCEAAERSIVAEYFQRVFAVEFPEALTDAASPTNPPPSA